MIRPFVDKLSQKLRSFSVHDTSLSGSLKKYDFNMGDTFQIYSVKGKKLHEYVDLKGYPATETRARIFKKWINPLLSDLENKTFCVHLGDRPCDETVEGMPNLCYCKRKSDERDLKLIPDTYYQGQNGYVNKNEYRKLYKTRWEKKIEKVVFRGSYTGEKPLGKNMRAQLCSLENPLIDAKITGVNNSWEEEEICHLRGKHMSKYEMGQYKYQVDIDGNTNAWDAFFWKLMSGSLSFKLPSEWHQWYYSQIQAGTHYVEFYDFDDLVDKVMFYKKHDEIAARIAFNAQDFTKGLGFQEQYAVFLEALND